MERYAIGEKLGEGSFGHVFFAVKKSTNEKRAIKRLKSGISWDKIAFLRELQCIIRVSLHENIVRLYEVHRTASATLYFVFEYMPDGSLHELLQDRTMRQLGPMPIQQLQSLTRQVLLGLQHLHSYQQTHRDVKPENLLLSGDTIKVADFSLARRCTETDTTTPTTTTTTTAQHHVVVADPLTSYVSTRWYRAPEVLLRAPVYGTAVDVFAAGCIVAEMCRQSPLFPGKTELDQMDRIFRVTGAPCADTWSDGVQWMQLMGMQPPTSAANAAAAANNKGQSVDTIFILSQYLSAAPPEQPDAALVDFVARLLTLNPNRRLTALQALSHPFLAATAQQDENQRDEYQASIAVAAALTPTGTLSTSPATTTVTVSPLPRAEISLHRRHLQQTVLP